MREIMANQHKPKRLTRSLKDRKVSGVCAGIAQYFNWDPSLVRLAMLFFILATGFFPGLVFYIIAAIVIPEGDNNA
jgi:phage shock protein PspC (stress-responsive transcriptional regulator)